MKINHSCATEGCEANDKRMNDILGAMQYVLEPNSIKDFIRRVVNDPSSLERVMFHLGEPLSYHIKRLDNFGDEEMVEVRLIHRGLFPEWEGLLKEYRREDIETWRIVEIRDTINAKLMEIFGDDMGEVSCGHSHDCCGCWFTHGYSVKFRGNLIRLKRYWYRNF